MRDLGKLLLIAGGVLMLLGLLLSFTPAGRLPGDFSFRRGNLTFYFPLMTSLLLSIIISILFWLFRR
jgi:hypothetical protein